MRFLRWLMSPVTTRLAVIVAWLMGDQMGYFSGLNKPWWYGCIVAAAAISLYWLAERLLARLLHRKAAHR